MGFSLINPVIFYPEGSFRSLTTCNDWRQQLPAAASHEEGVVGPRNPVIFHGGDISGARPEKVFYGPKIPWVSLAQMRRMYGIFTYTFYQ